MKRLIAVCVFVCVLAAGFVVASPSFAAATRKSNNIRRIEEQNKRRIEGQTKSSKSNGAGDRISGSSYKGQSKVNQSKVNQSRVNQDKVNQSRVNQQSKGNAAPNVIVKKRARSR